ncbi:MAG: MFS transporter [Steroidobacteraceae bacterium]
MALLRIDPTAFARWRNATLAPFAHRVFAVFWWATLISSLGSLIQSVGAAWLMTTIAPSPDQVALVQTAGALPFFFFSLIAGAYADTHDRRIIMLGSQLLMLAAAIVLAMLAYFDQVTPELLLGLTFLIGCGTAAFAPAWQASIGEQVPRELIPSAVMANAVGFNMARSVGPAVGGLIVAAAGAAVAFTINAVSYVGTLAALVWWRPVRNKNPLPPEPLGAAIAAGTRYVRLSPHLMAILARCALFTIPMAAAPALMPIVARDLLGGGAPTYGLLLGAFGVGAMLAALSSATLRARYASDTLLRTAGALAFIALLAIGQSRWLALTLLAHLLAGSVWTLALANFNIAVQLSSPRWVMGRTLAMYQTVAFAGVAVGSWLWGQVGHVVGVRESLSIAAIAALISLLAARWTPVSVAGVGAFDPHTRSEIAPPKFEIHPASGPIIVTIEYRVPSDNAVKFVALINELGRIRRRDGARWWSVCQDIDDPELWAERFESPTWMDYLRRQTRPTRADQDVRRQIAELIGGGRGTMRRFLERPRGAEPLGTEQRRPPLDDSSGHA